MLALVADGQACARFFAPGFITAMVIQVGMGETRHIGTPAAYHLFVERPEARDAPPPPSSCRRRQAWCCT